MNSIVKICITIVWTAGFAVCISISTGCVAIPMGAQTFTTEYPTGVEVTTDAPVQTYAPELVVEDGDQFHRTTKIGLAAKITIEQPQVQKFEKITLEKRKRMAFGFLPGTAEYIWSPDSSLHSMAMWAYYGNGRYRTKAPGDINDFGMILGMFPMTVYATIASPFTDSYECSSHHWADKGRDISDANLLTKFPLDDRNRIGAWTWNEADTHKQRPFVSAFTHSALFGFHKYCCYTIKCQAEEDRPSSPKVTTFERMVVGPYSVTLSIPDLGFIKTIDVRAGETAATFDLVGSENGQGVVNGTVRFSPPLGGMPQVKNADDRACLEEAQEHDYAVKISLPAPRL